MKKTVYLTLTLLLALFTACKEDNTVWYSLNVYDLSIHPRETYQFTVKEQSMEFNQLYAGDIIWSVSDTTLAKIENAGDEIIYVPNDTIVTITETDTTTTIIEGYTQEPVPGRFTARAEGEVTVQAVLANGRTLMTTVTINAWTAPDPSGLVLSRYEIYQAVDQISVDTLTLSVSDDILSKFEVEVTSSNTAMINPVLIAPTNADLAAGNKDYKIALVRGEDRKTEEDVTISVVAGDTEVACVVHIGMRLYLAFGEINLGLGDNPDLVTESTFRIVMDTTDNLAALNTIAVNYLLLPGDAEHIAKMKEAMTVTTSGNSVLVIEKTEYTTSQFLIYVRGGRMVGSTDIIVEAFDQKVTATCQVVDIRDTEVTSVTFDRDGIKSLDGIEEDANGNFVTYERGYSLFDYLSVDPFSAIVDWPVVWTSSDESVAVVNNEGEEAGSFTIYKAGTFTITATSKDKSDAVTFIAKLRLTGINIASNVVTTLSEGETAHWTATLTDWAGYKTDDVVLTWASSNEEVATVDATGVITAKAAGTATITVSATDDYGNTVTAEKDVTVTALDLDDVDFGSSDFGWEIYDVNQLGVFNEDGTITATFYFTTNGSDLDFTTPATLTYGTDFVAGSNVEYYNENEDIFETLQLSGGSLTVNADATITFNLKAAKGNATISITGTCFAW